MGSLEKLQWRLNQNLLDHNPKGRDLNRPSFSIQTVYELDPGMQSVPAVRDLLKPDDVRIVRCCPVSIRINHVANDDQECCARVEPAEIENSRFS